MIPVTIDPTASNDSTNCIAAAAKEGAALIADEKAQGVGFLHNVLQLLGRRWRAGGRAA